MYYTSLITITITVGIVGILGFIYGCVCHDGHSLDEVDNDVKLA